MTEITRDPLLSIVTVSLNNSLGLLNTFNSICSQSKIEDYSLVEWVVIDGDSNDASVPFLRSLNPPFPIKWISEQDDGIFDAMNKGIMLSKGDYIIFINSGDLFSDSNVLNYFLPILKKGTAKIYAGLVAQIYEKHTKLSDLAPWVCHQSVFVRKSLLISFKFDVSLKYYGDLDLWKRLKQAGHFQPVRFQRTVALFCMGGVGNNPIYIFKRLKERTLLADKYNDEIPNIIRYIVAFCLYLVFKVFGKKIYYRVIMK